MRELSLINILGSNATGKSTRVSYLTKWLDSHWSSEGFEYNTVKKGLKDIGKFYPELGLLILGGNTRKGGWVSLDRADLSSYEQKLNFYKDIAENFPQVVSILQEGYFNNRSVQGSPNNLRNWGITSSKMYFLYYDKVEDFLERTNARSGKTERGLDWAENSPGWRDNATVQETEERYLKDCNEMLDIIKKVDINADKTYFITELFGNDFEIDMELFVEPEVIEEVKTPKVVEEPVEDLLNLF